MDEFSYMEQLIQFGGTLITSKKIIYFDTEKQVNKALEWIESLIVMNRLLEVK
jgi:hypothetical protein